MPIPVPRGTCSRTLKPLLPAWSGLFLGVLAADFMAISAQEPVRWTRRSPFTGDNDFYPWALP